MDIKKEFERWLVNATADADVAAELKMLDDAGISDSRWHSHNWHFYLRYVLELPRYTPPS